MSVLTIEPVAGFYVTIYFLTSFKVDMLCSLFTSVLSVDLGLKIIMVIYYGVDCLV